MAIVDHAVGVLHMLVAALWTGSVFFVTVAVLPTARDGGIDADPFQRIAGRLTTVTRVSVLLLLLTGAHQAATLYTAETLTGDRRGHLVLGMVLLWLVLTGLVEVGTARLIEGTEQLKVRQPAAEARPFFLAASAVAVILLVVAGLLYTSLQYGLPF